MTNPDRVWVLGPASAAMDTVESILRAVGETVAFATGPGGGRILVHPWGPDEGRGVDPRPALAWGTKIYLVGCDGVRLRNSCGITLQEVQDGHPGREFRVFDPVEALREVLASAGIGIGGDADSGWYACIPASLPDRVHQAVDPERLGPLLYPDD